MPAPTPPGIHWDQVCHDGRVPVGLPVASQVFRTPEAHRGLAVVRRGAGLAPDTLRAREVGLSRDGDGGVRVWPLRGNVPGEVARAVDSLLVATLRDDAPLPSPVPLRVLVRLNGLPHLETFPPLRCDPHRAHTGTSIREVEPGVRVSTLLAGRGSAPRAVQVEIRVDEEGTITGVRVLRASTDSALTARAVSVARSLRFHPALLNGRPVEGTVRRTIRFPARGAGGS